MIAALAACNPAPPAAPAVSFRNDVAPIIEKHCVSCHVPGKPGAEASGFVVDSYAALMKGTKFGAVVIPKEPDSSSLYALIAGKTSPQIRMPFGHKPLPNCLVQNVWSWIFEGAKDN